MTEQKGRKKHMVEGDVAEVKKGEEGLGLGKLSEGVGLLQSIVNLFSSDKGNKGKKNGKK